MRAHPALYALPVLALAVLSTFAIAAAHPAAPSAATGPTAAVFTMTNNATANQVIAYDRSASGGLTWAGSFSTGGTGTGASLADSGALAITSNHRWLLVVDAGSNQLTVFGVSPRGGSPVLWRASVSSSHGTTPVSVAVHGNLVYVLNVGGASSAGDIAGFRLTPHGNLQHIAGSDRPLSTSAATGAAQIAFDPRGGALVVTEKATNVVELYGLSSGGVARGPTSFASNGTTPYGFAVAPDGVVVVSNAASGSLTSYAVPNARSLSVVSGSVSDSQGAPCWVQITSGGRFAYTTNAHSASISSYALSGSGRLTLLNATAASTGSTPTDLALIDGQHLLYVYDAGASNIEGFAIGANGGLTWVATASGLPATAEGLVAI